MKPYARHSCSSKRDRPHVTIAIRSLAQYLHMGCADLRNDSMSSIDEMDANGSSSAGSLAMPHPKAASSVT